MGNLKKIKEENFENMKIGFLLELWFRQCSFSEELKKFISFLEDNKQFLTIIDLHCITQVINNINDMFTNSTDLIFYDVDFNEIYCKYHKDFY